MAEQAQQPTTRLHVSGYRFLVRRMEHALVRGDTRMLDDPLRAQSLSFAAGILLAAVAVVVCAVLALVRPSGDLGDAPIVVARETGAMYVRIDGTLHPAFNLASARLIAGTPADPRIVSQRAIDSAPHGPQVGIPGAPQTISSRLTPEESSWTVCDDARGATSVIAGASADGVAESGPGVLVTPRGGSAAVTFLLYDGRRARVDLRHPAVVRALRLDGVAPRQVSEALLSAIPEAPEIVPPRIPAVGTPGPGTLHSRPVGTVVKVHRTDGGSAADYFVVLATGVQRVGEVAADLIRYTDSRVGEQIPTVAPGVIGTVSVVDTLPVTTFPDHGGVTDAPVVCARWRADPQTGATYTTVLTGEAVPVTGRPVALAQADGEGPAVDEASLPSGRSAFVRSVGLTGDGQSAGSMFLVTDSGVRFGISDQDAAASLGFTEQAQPGPWPVLALLPQGPELSQRAASVARDGLVASP